MTNPDDYLGKPIEFPAGSSGVPPEAITPETEPTLPNLVAVQNGPPLIRDAATWQAAMDAAEDLLDKEVE